MKYDFYESSYKKLDDMKISDKGSKAGWEVASTLTDGILGLADWIGLGTAIRGLVDSSHPELGQIKTTLTNRINALLSKDQIDIDKLEQKLSDLASMGFSLTGVARSKYVDEVRRAKDTLSKAKQRQANRTIELAKAQADVDSIKDFQNTSNLYDYVHGNKEIASHVEEQLNKMEN